MGSIFRIKNKYSVQIIPGDHRPPHIHIIGGGCEAKLRIDTLECYFVVGFKRKDIKEFQLFLNDKKELLMEAWNEINEE
jgi:hypothetical protein